MATGRALTFSLSVMYSWIRSLTTLSATVDACSSEGRYQNRARSLLRVARRTHGGHRCDRVRLPTWSALSFAAVLAASSLLAFVATTLASCSAFFAASHICGT